MQIGKLEIKGRLFLAPMSNVTNLPFRLLCKRYGAAMVYSEMINADAFIMESNKTLRRAYFIDEERPVGIQLSGSGVEKLEIAIKKAERELKPDLIDINLGCPAYSVMKNGCGASLLNDPEKVKDIVSRLSAAVQIPLTCKIRILPSVQKTIEIARIIEKSGAQALTVHGRTAKQGYSGKADWNTIKKIRESIGIPLILNGDVMDEKSAETALSTGCDALMIGRAAIGNPYVFKMVNSYLDSGIPASRQSIMEKAGDFAEYVNFCVKYNYKNIASIKMQAHNFIKGYKAASAIREKISKCETVDSILDLAHAYFYGMDA